jgi:hypothetical protein
MGTEYVEHERHLPADGPVARSARHESTDTPSAAAPDIGLPPIRLGGSHDSMGRVRRAAAIGHAASADASADRSTTRIQRSADPARIPEELQAGVEELSGVSVSDVRVQRNSSRPAQVGALAYAQGDEIHLGPGQEEHLAHEAWHIVQQRQGRVRRTLQLRTSEINDDDALEHEADVMGARALAAGRHAASAGGVDAIAAPAVQRSTRRTGRAGGVMQLINAKDKKALNAIKGEVTAMTDKTSRWKAIKKALDALSTGTDPNVIDGAKYLGVEVEKPLDTAPVVTAKPVKKRSADDVWNHVTKGGTNSDGGPTGYHTIHGKGAIAQGFGDKTMLGYGCYKQNVRLINKPEKVKSKPSTFFPDDWSLDDIREAIEYAVPVGNLYEVTTPAKGKGMKLFKNADSWFPYFD